jgi:hypothetical protein
MDEYIMDDKRNLPTPPSEEEIVNDNINDVTEKSEDTNISISQGEKEISVTENELENESIHSVPSPEKEVKNDDDDNIPSASEIIKKAKSKSIEANSTISKLMAGMYYLYIYIYIYIYIYVYIYI